MPIHPKRLKALRRQAAMTREDLEAEARLPQMFLWRAESGEMLDPPLSMLEQLANALAIRLGRQVAISDFVTDPPDPDPVVQMTRPQQD